MSAFRDRRRELAALEAIWQAPGAVFCTLSGRRRVGKSRLLAEFLRDRPHAYLTGTQQTAANQLRDASRALHRETGDPVLAHQDFTGWDALLAYVAARAEHTRFALVLDEFSHFADATPGLESILQRWWDGTAQHGQLTLFLADSHLAFMRRLTQGDQPLFGRPTHRLTLEPLDYADASLFFPAFSPLDRLRAYGVFGGMPAYLSGVDPTLSVRDNVHRLVFASAATLRYEPDYLFAQERSIADPTSYRSVLRAIAAGHTQPNDIAQAAGYRSPQDIAGILERLRGLGLVDRIVPLGAPPGGRISRYAVADWFLDFWFRFVAPSEALIAQEAGHLAVEDLFADDGRLLDEFVSRPQGPWERACASYLVRAQREGKIRGLRFDTLGCWWEGRGASQSSEIDIVGRRSRSAGLALAASCKWRRAYMKLADLDELRATARRAGAGEKTLYVLFSRSGFDPNLVRHAEAEGVVLVTPEQMFEV